jgi:hypothetical protein
MAHLFQLSNFALLPNLPFDTKRRIEDLMNWLSDRDWGWWPLLSLRPPRTKVIDGLLLWKITAGFGTAAGVILVALHLWRTGGVTLQVLATYLMFGWGAFFFLYKCTFAYCWNRRAKRLRAENARR